MKLSRFFAILAVLLPALCPAQTTPGYIITTVAGNGAHGFDGEGGAGASASLNYPQGVAVDRAGTVYIADCFNHRVRSLSTAGIITTVAGTGTVGNTGDGGAATSATMNDPCAVAVDAAGDVYIADTGNHVIRKRVSGGTLSKLAGKGYSGFAGDGAKAVDAELNTPLGVAVDSAGNVYIADTVNNRIRKVTTDGNIATIAGTGASGYGGEGDQASGASLFRPHGLAVDSGGNLYIADTFNHRVRKISPDGVITTVAGTGERGFSGDGGPATKAMLCYPKGVAVDASGNLYIADTFNNRIRRVAEDDVITTIAGSGIVGDRGDWDLATRAQLRFPSGVAVGPNGLIYIADDQNSRIRLLTPLEPPAGPVATQQ